MSTVLRRSAGVGAVVSSMVPSESAWVSVPQATCSFPPTTPITVIYPTDAISSPLTITSESALRSTFATWLATLAPWSLYLTLTYDPKRPEVHHVPPSKWAVARHVRQFHLRASAILARPTFAAVATEDTRAGWPHAHGLLAAGVVDSREFAALSQAWYSARGFARFDRIQAGTQNVVAEYVAKYLTKESSEVLLLGPWLAGRAPIQNTLSFRRGGGRVGAIRV